MEMRSIPLIQRTPGGIGRAQGPAAPSMFHQMLTEAVQQVRQTESTAAIGTETLLGTAPGSLHQVMIDLEKADIALQFTIQLRNKMLEAYQEIMRMQV